MMMETPSHLLNSPSIHNNLNNNQNNDRELDNEALSSLLLLAQVNESPDSSVLKDDTEEEMMDVIQKEDDEIPAENDPQETLSAPSPEMTESSKNDEPMNDIEELPSAQEQISEAEHEPESESGGEKVETPTPEKSSSTEKSTSPSLPPTNQALTQAQPQTQTQVQTQPAPLNQPQALSQPRPLSAVNPINNRTITLEELRKFFHLPIAEVAKQFGTCTTALKKICRKLQINKWPYRQILSLSKSIQSLEMASLSDGVSNEQRAQYRSQISILQQMIAEVVQDPSKAMESLSKELEIESSSSTTNKAERNADVENLINAATATLSKSNGPSSSSSAQKPTSLSVPATSSSSQAPTAATTTAASSAHKSKPKNLKRSSDSMDEGDVIGILVNNIEADGNRLKKGKLREDDHLHSNASRTLFTSPGKVDQFHHANQLNGSATMINGSSVVSSSGNPLNGATGLNNLSLQQKSSILLPMNNSNMSNSHLNSSGNNISMNNNGGNPHNSHHTQHNHHHNHHHHQQHLQHRIGNETASPMAEIVQPSVDVGLTSVNCTFNVDAHKYQFSGQVMLAPLHRKKFRPSSFRKVIPLMEPDIGSSFSVDFYPDAMIPKL